MYDAKLDEQINKDSLMPRAGGSVGPIIRRNNKHHKPLA
jgi:hypothetical protein